MDGAATFRTPADAYDRHVGRYTRELGRALIEAAAVRAGQRVLDVGCGPGALTAELVAVLGADQVAAADPSEPFAEACRARLPGVRVEVASAEALPFADAEFDCVLAQLVVNFMTDAHLGVREMRRATRPGGTVAAAVWDYAGEMTLLRRFWDAAVALDPAAEALDEKHMPYCTPATLAALWSEAALNDVRVTDAVVSADYDDFDDLWRPLESGVAPTGRYATSLSDEAARAELKGELRRRLGAGDEPFRLTARAWVVTGRAP